MGRHFSIKKIILFTGDCFIIACSIYLSILLRLNISVNIFTDYTGAAFFIILSYLLSFYLLDLYNPNYKIKSFVYLTRYLLAIIISALLIAVIFYFTPPTESPLKFGRGIYAINIVLVAVTGYVWRFLLNSVFIAFQKPKRVVIVGAGTSGRTIYHELQHSGEFQVLGFLDDRHEHNRKKIGAHEVIGGSNLLSKMVNEGDIDVAVVSITYKNNPDFIKDLLYCKMRGVEIFDIPHLYEELALKVPVQYLTDSKIAFTTFLGLRRNIYMTRIKPPVDKFLAFIGLLLTVPVNILASFAIIIDSRGPVFYRQSRVGLDGKIFQVTKFRSMMTDAEANGVAWAQDNDPRITRVGKVIRKLRIDEIPQMWNIMKGEMSFIGPRPERPEFVQHLSEELPFYAFRHSVKPGITGWAQVKYQYGASKEDALEKLQYDLYYIKNLSFLLDLNILLRTVRVVLFGKGAR